MITTEQIMQALRGVRDPELSRDVVELGMVHDDAGGEHSLRRVPDARSLDLLHNKEKWDIAHGSTRKNTDRSLMIREIRVYP